MDRQPYEQAVEWYVRLHNGNVTQALREEFTRWLLLSPDHISAFLEVSRTVGHVGPAAQGLSRDELVQAARANNSKSNVVRLGGGEPAATAATPRRHTFNRCCVIAVATAALLASIMALSWFARDRWLCAADVAHTTRTGSV
jgi:ferric-dicitrate binding protein FerR (iron transport regulator)